MANFIKICSICIHKSSLVHQIRKPVHKERQLCCVGYDDDDDEDDGVVQIRKLPLCPTCKKNRNIWNMCTYVGRYIFFEQESINWTTKTEALCWWCSLQKADIGYYIIVVEELLLIARSFLPACRRPSPPYYYRKLGKRWKKEEECFEMLTAEKESDTFSIDLTCLLPKNPLNATP